jgi:cardiolipin synthase
VEKLPAKTSDITRQSERHRLNAANLLTSARIVLILPFLFMISSGEYAAALGIFFLASLTDFADGYVARNFAQQTQLGRLLDPLADKALITCAYVAMAVQHTGLPSIPMWLAIAVISRDALILLGSLVIYLTTRFKDFKPSMISKVNTFVELGFIVYFLSVNATESLSFLRVLQPVFNGIVLISVIISGVDYAFRGVVIVRTHRHREGTTTS